MIVMIVPFTSNSTLISGARCTRLIGSRTPAAPTLRGSVRRSAEVVAAADGLMGLFTPASARLGLRRGRTAVNYRRRFDTSDARTARHRRSEAPLRRAGLWIGSW